MGIDDVFDHVERRNQIRFVLPGGTVKGAAGNVEVFLLREPRTRRAWFESILGPALRQGREKGAIATTNVQNSFARDVSFNEALELFIKAGVARIGFRAIKIGGTN